MPLVIAGSYFALSCWAVAMLLTSSGIVAAERPPNILFIMADDLGVRDLTCYGSDYYRTPNLDKLADEGMRFTRAYAASNVCSPTRASILTGRYPQRVHLTDALPWDRLFDNPKMVPPDHFKQLPRDLPTFAKALRPGGYRTALFGKWHLGNEYEFFTENGHAAYGFDEAFDASFKERARDKSVDELTGRATRFLEENMDRPFILCLMHHTPHVPLASPPEDEALYDDAPKGRFQKNQEYAGMISHMDQSVNTVMDKLTELGLDENTIVIFTSDNGGWNGVTSNKPYRGGKGNLYEGGTRVPLILRWPGRIKAGVVSDAPVHSVDWFPTFLDLAGLTPMPQAHVDGMSMLPLLKGMKAEHRALYWHFPHRRAPSSSVIDGDWKLIHWIVSGRYELFDLKADPAEEHDLSVQMPERTDHMVQLLEGHLRESGAQHMRINPEWNPDREGGKLTNYGTFHRADGRILQIVEEPRPKWFTKVETK